jgi:invasion protein IalB
MSVRLEPIRRPPAAVIVTTLLLFALSGRAWTQQPAQSQEGGLPTRPEVGPRGQRIADEITYGDWRKFCFRAGGSKMLCRTTITGTFQTGQTAVRVDLIEREADGRARLQLFLPVGMYLQAGVKLRVDQGKPSTVPYTWCVTNACIAADVVDPKIIKEMESGQTLSLEVVENKMLSVTTSLPLRGFASVRKGAPAQSFEQDIDE